MNMTTAVDSYLQPSESCKLTEKGDGHGSQTSSARASWLNQLQNARTASALYDIRSKISPAETTAIKSSAEAAIKSTKDMSMEEYKDYIHSKISRIPLHPSRMMDSITIHISEAGFEAMKNDPEYEKYVIDLLERDFAAANPWTALCGGCYCIYNIGAAKEECSGQSWYSGYQNGRGKKRYDELSEESFWEKRTKRHKEYMERSIALARKHRWEEMNQPQEGFASNIHDIICELFSEKGRL